MHIFLQEDERVGVNKAIDKIMHVAILGHSDLAVALLNGTASQVEMCLFSAYRIFSHLNPASNRNHSFLFLFSLT